MRMRITAAGLDKVLAVVFVIWAAVQVAVMGDQLEPNRLVGGTAMIIVCAGVAWRREHPFVVGVGTQAIMSVTATYGQLIAGPCTIGWFCALYALAVWTTDRQFVAGLAFFVVSDLWPGLSHGHIGDSAGSFTLGAVIVMLLGRVVIGGRDRRLSLAQRERDVAAREAVVEERARIARELHDVIAHHVSTMVVQAGAERRMLEPDRDETREVLGTIERVGRGALTEMRRMVSMLRQEDADELAPQPTLADVPALVEQMRAAGVRVDLSTTGEPVEVPTGIGLSAYRIVQEALTNALKHSHGAAAFVEITYGTDRLDLVVRDDGRGARASDVEGAGVGLVGMRERVALYGGQFQAGPENAGGYAVRVQLPVR
jgi:signal transduction histidine kinase